MAERRRNIESLNINTLAQTYSLIPYQELKPAEHVDIGNFSNEQIHIMYHLFKGVCGTQFRAVAGTQINSNLLKAYELSAATESIYLNWSSFGPHANKLLINPKVISFSSERLPVIEGCGSIDGGRTLMIVERPISYIIDSIVIDPEGNLTQETLHFEDYQSGVLDHELAHLNGLTALDNPARLLHPNELTPEQSSDIDVYAKETGSSFDEIKFVVGYSALLKWAVPTSDGWAYAPK